MSTLYPKWYSLREREIATIFLISSLIGITYAYAKFMVGPIPEQTILEFGHSFFFDFLTGVIITHIILVIFVLQYHLVAKRVDYGRFVYCEEKKEDVWEWN